MRPERVVAAYGDEDLEIVTLKGGDALVHAVGLLGGIGARSAQNGAAARQDAADGRQVEHHGHIVNDSAPAFEKPHELVVVMNDALADDGADDGVEARAIAAAGKHSDLHTYTSK